VSLRDSEVMRLELPARHTYLHIVSDCIAHLLRLADGLDDAEMVIYNVQLATHEACTNIVTHAYADCTAGEGRIEACLALHPDPMRIEIELRDTGKSFDLTSIPPPSLLEPQVHGYGLFLIRSLMDDVHYQPQQGVNCWSLVKNL
jgi:serine/threonine-protein kinase RsbW